VKESRGEKLRYTRVRVCARVRYFSFFAFTPSPGCRILLIHSELRVKTFAICLHRRAPPALFTAERRIDDDFRPIARISRGLFPESSVLSGENRTRSVRFLMNSELKMSPFAQALFKKTAMG